MEPVLSNPAGRLLEILDSGLSVPKNQSVIDAWTAVLGVDGETNRSTIFTRIAFVMTLPDQVKEAISELNLRQPETYLRFVPVVRNAFAGSTNMDAAWSSFINHIDERTIDSVQAASDIIEITAKPDQIPAADLESLSNQVRDLLEELEHADLDEDLRQFLLVQLMRSMNALDRFRFFGKDSLVEAAENIVGSSVLNKDIADKAYETSVGKKVWDHVKTVLALIQAVESTAGLIQSGAETINRLSG